MTFSYFLYFCAFCLYFAGVWRFLALRREKKEKEFVINDIRENIKIGDYHWREKREPKKLVTKLNDEQLADRLLPEIKKLDSDIREKTYRDYQFMYNHVPYQFSGESDTIYLTAGDLSRLLAQEIRKMQKEKVL